MYSSIIIIHVLFIIIVFNLWFSIVKFESSRNATFFGVIRIQIKRFYHLILLVVTCLLYCYRLTPVVSSLFLVSYWYNIELDLDSIFDDQLSQVNISIPTSTTR